MNYFEKRRLIIRIVVIVLVAALGVAAVAVVLNDTLSRRKAEKISAQMQEELVKSGLTVEKLELERELSALDDSDGERLSTVVILFREPNEQIYDSIFSVMQLFSFTGTICISPTEMPNDDGNITYSEYDYLVNHGYSTAIHYDGSMPLGDYLALLKTKCDALKIAMPDTVYYAGKVNGKYINATSYDNDGMPDFSGFDEAISEYGISYVIQETYQKKTVAYENFYTDFRYAEALGFNAVYSDGTTNYALASASIYNAMKSGAAVVMSVAFDYESSYGGYYGKINDSYGGGTLTDDFARMIKALDGYSASLMVTDMAGIEKYRVDYNKNLPDAEAIEARRQALEERLAVVNQEIEKIKNKYEYK